MPLASGTQLGHYKIQSLIGKGGMGEVYRAVDTKLEREVAIKVLPAALADDPERLARFEREAKVLAQLNHPGIAAIHGVEDRALVMELVPGPTLADRIKQGPIPPGEAEEILLQMADGLEYAHERGVIHRDLKPANIKIDPEDKVKILDFGLAKALTDPGSSIVSDPTNSPTVTIGGTVAGTLLGTAAYMAPEQARGKKVDKRADIWAFGVVAWEMLTGDRLFQGEDTVQVLSRVLEQKPDLERVPLRFRKLLARCLDRNVKDRLRDIGEARFWFEEPAQPYEARLDAESQSHKESRRGWLWPASAALFILALGALSFVHFRKPAPAAPQVLQYTIDPPPKNRIANFALSPDGHYVAAVGSDTQLWVRALDSLQWQALAGMEGAGLLSVPFWSPDNRNIAIVAAGKLKKVAVGGGPVQTLCDLSGSGSIGAAWSQDGVIVFSTQGSLLRVPAAGGTPTRLPVSIASRFPWFLPDGRQFLYTSAATSSRGLFLESVDIKGSQPHRIAAESGNAQYVPPLTVNGSASGNGHLLFVREQTLMAQPAKPDTLDPAGEAFPVVQQVSSIPGSGYSLYSASSNGILAYMSGSADRLQHWIFDRNGKQVAAIGAPANTEGRVAFSPDGKRMISERGAVGKPDLWITDLERGTESRFTFGDFSAIAPVWSPDGSRVAFASVRGGVPQVYTKLANQTGQDELVLRSESIQIPSDWTHDGRFILVRQTSPGTNHDIIAIPVSGDHKPIPLLQSRFNEIEGVVSPDGRWLAYASDESGHFEVYVQPFAPGSSKPAAGKWQISQGGGRDPHWRGDGRELFYVAADRKMTAVDVKTSGDTFIPGTPKPLFEARMFVDGTISRYAVSADGQRFLMAPEPEASTESPIHVTVNWLAGVRK
jgi:serine/threonine protein kinase